MNILYDTPLTPVQKVNVLYKKCSVAIDLVA